MGSDGWNFNHSALNESRLRPLCEQVEKHFQLRSRVYRYFAVDEDEYLRNECDEHYRGFHCPITQRIWLPPYLLNCFFKPLDTGRFDSFDEMVAFENLIYIRASTCADLTGCLLTYAHELQHATQYERSPRLLRVNQALYWNLKRFEPNSTASDVPHEREANIISKRVVEAVCGVDAVRQFAEMQVKRMQELGESEQVARWVFFRDVSSSTEYDFLQSTLPLIERYKGMIEFGTDTNESAWWMKSDGGSSVETD